MMRRDPYQAGLEVGKELHLAAERVDINFPSDCIWLKGKSDGEDLTITLSINVFRYIIAHFQQVVRYHERELSGDLKQIGNLRQLVPMPFQTLDIVKMVICEQPSIALIFDQRTEHEVSYVLPIPLAKELAERMNDQIEAAVAPELTQ